MSDSPKMVATRGTDERFTVRYLVDFRGKALALTILDSLTEAQVTDVYYGRPVTDDVWASLKKTLRERMTHD
jgi:hypothetical protein